jgi:hypothetical protein
MGIIQAIVLFLTAFIMGCPSPKVSVCSVNGMGFAHEKLEIPCESLVILEKAQRVARYHDGDFE